MKKHAYILVAILLLGAGLRLCNIGWGLPDKTHRWPYQIDEASGLLCLKSMNPANGSFSIDNFGTTFYIYSLGFWLKSLSVLGIITTVNSEDFYRENIEKLAKIYLSGRILTVLMGAVSIFLLYLLGKLFYDYKIGLTAAFFIAILPFSVIHSHFATGHIQFTALCLLSLIFCKLLLDDGRLRWYVLFGFSTGLALGTSWFLGANPIAAFLVSHYFRYTKKGLGMFAERNFIIAIGVTIFAFFISSPYTFLTPGRFVSEWQYYLPLCHLGVKNLYIPFFEALPYGFGKYLFYLSICGILLAIAKNTKEDRMLLIWAGIYYLAVALSGWGIFIRRFSPLVYIMALFAARFVIAAIGSLANRRFLKIGFQILLSFIILYSLFYTMALLQAMNTQDTRTLGRRWINENIPPGSKIAVCNYFLTVPHFDITRYKTVHGIKKDEEPDHQYYITNRPITEKEYVLMKSFVERPAFLGFIFDDSKAPFDMKYSHPEIYIYKKVEK